MAIGVAAGVAVGGEVALGTAVAGGVAAGDGAGGGDDSAVGVAVSGGAGGGDGAAVGVTGRADEVGMPRSALWKQPVAVSSKQTAITASARGIRRDKRSLAIPLFIT